MSEDYLSQKDYIDLVQDEADERQSKIEAALREAFSQFIEYRETEIVLFSDMSAFDIARAIVNNPIILKSLLSCCNIAARAIERDLDIKNLNTYLPRLDKDKAKVIAGYIKPFLPPYIELPTLSKIDRVYYIDKEIRKSKGRWEKLIIKALNKYATITFSKRKFKAEGEKFEIDAASPTEGDIKYAIDIKRIEARRDIHKRCDEIVNKANKLKSSYPEARFGAIVYYPFFEEHINVQNRLKSTYIDGVVFASASEGSIINAVKLLLAQL